MKYRLTYSDLVLPRQSLIQGKALSETDISVVTPFAGRFPYAKAKSTAQPTKPAGTHTIHQDSGGVDE